MADTPPPLAAGSSRWGTLDCIACFVAVGMARAAAVEDRLG